MYPNIETAADYAQYQAAVADWRKRNRADMIGSAIKCSECGRKLEDQTCPRHGYMGDSHFSRLPCDCCNRALGGNRETVTYCQHKPGVRTRIHEADICEDCVYYLEYGQLDDVTMLAVES